MTESNAARRFQDWRERSEDDERAIHDLLDHAETHANIICFLAQQMAEKLLKGLVSFAGFELMKTHDLIELGKLLGDRYPGVASLASDLKILNEYYIEPRYPGDYPELSEREAREAAQAAEHIKAFVLAQISE